MPRAGIIGVATYVPPDVLTNEHLEQFVDTSDEWITKRVGVKERHILLGEGKGISDMAVPAVQRLLEQTRTAPDEIDMIIVATVTPDHVFPATANIIADKVGLTRAWGYDMNAACSGFLYALWTASRFIESGVAQRIIVVGADKMSAIINYHDRTTCVIFGDGAGAVLLAPVTEGGIQDAAMYSDGAGRHHLFQKAGGSCYPPTIDTVMNQEHYVYQEGKKVFQYAVKRMAEAIEEVLTRNQLTADDIRLLVPHQANLRIIRAVAQQLNMPMERVAVNIDRYGNTTNATLPLCLDEWQHQLQPMDKIILATFGGGFTWGAIYMQWTTPDMIAKS